MAKQTRTNTIYLDYSHLFEEDFEDEFDLDIGGTLYKTAELVFAEEVAKMYFPYRSGHTQNDDTNIQKGTNEQGDYADIVSANPYVRRLYYHPEFNFYREKNTRAGGRWHSKISTNFVEKTFQQLL